MSRVVLNESLKCYWCEATNTWGTLEKATRYADTAHAGDAVQPMLALDRTVQLKILDPARLTPQVPHRPLTIGQIAALCSVANGNYEHQYAKDTRALCDLGLVFAEEDNQYGVPHQVLALTAAGHRHVASLLSVYVGTTIVGGEL